MSILKEEIAQIDLDAPEVKNSALLQNLFLYIDRNFKKQNPTPTDLMFGQNNDEVKRYVVALAHPYKLSADATKEIQQVVGTFNPNKDDTATGREIADALLAHTDGAVSMLLTKDVPIKDQEKLTEFIAETKGLLWGIGCGIGPMEEQSAKQLFGTAPGPLESGYHQLWTAESIRQNFLLREMFIENEDAQNTFRLPHNVWKELPKFIQIPDGKDVCHALEDNIQATDPGNAILAAKDGNKEDIKQKIEEGAERLRALAKDIKPKDRPPTPPGKGDILDIDIEIDFCPSVTPQNALKDSKENGKC